MHGRGRRLVQGALVLLALLAVLAWASAALGAGANPPEVTTEAAATVTKTTATLSGTVNPKGVAVTSCEFRYGTSPGSLSSSAECTPKPGSGLISEAVSAEVMVLSPNTTCHLQVLATGEEGTGEGSTVSFKTIANATVASTGKAGEVKLTSAVLAGSVNPEGASVTKCEFKYGTTAGSLGLTAPCSPAPGSGTAPEAVAAQVTKLTPGTTYHFELIATGEGGEGAGKEEEFTTPASGLAVVTGKAASVTRTTAKLTGTVNPGGSPVTECEFEYGTTAGSPEATIPCSALPGAGTEDVAVSAEITESTPLQPNTTYYFKLVAENEAGTPVEGTEEHFTTLPNRPRVDTGAASGVGQGSATVSGTVNPEGAELISCTFEYGTAPSQLGTSVPCSSLPPAGASPVGVSATLAGLSPGTTYYYRLVAENAGEEGAGSEGSFTTAAAPSPSPTPTPTVTPTPTPTPTPKGPEPARPPVVSSLNESNSVFRVGRSSTAPGGRISRVSPTGTVFSFALDQPAVVGVVFIHEESGHLIGKHCVVGRGGRGKPACVHTSLAMTLGRRALYGLNKLPFTGRVRGKALRPGAYRATFTAESLAGASSPATISFRVVAH